MMWFWYNRVINLVLKKVSRTPPWWDVVLSDASVRLTLWALTPDTLLCVRSVFHATFCLSLSVVSVVAVEVCVTRHMKMTSHEPLQQTIPRERHLCHLTSQKFPQKSRIMN